MCVLVGLSVGLVCVHARPLLVSPVHATKLFNVYQWIRVDQRPGCNSMTCILGYTTALILLRTMVRGVVVIYCLKRSKMQGNENKMGNII